MKKSKKKDLIFKRIIDVVISGIGLIILFPIFVVIGALIKLNSKGPVFFLQERVGKNKKIFKIIKLRTMFVSSEKKTQWFNIDKENPNVTNLGFFLRRWGIDELPQIINVLKGEMSLVGPRATVKRHLIKFNYYQCKRFLVKPGITGWALVNGRNSISWRRRIELDIWYINNWSFILDIKILLKTIFVILKGEGLYSDKIIEDDWN